MGDLRPPPPLKGNVQSKVEYFFGFLSGLVQLRRRGQLQPQTLACWSCCPTWWGGGTGKEPSETFVFIFGFESFKWNGSLYIYPRSTYLFTCRLIYLSACALESHLKLAIGFRASFNLSCYFLLFVYFIPFSYRKINDFMKNLCRKSD